MEILHKCMDSMIRLKQARMERDENDRRRIAVAIRRSRAILKTDGSDDELGNSLGSSSSIAAAGEDWRMPGRSFIAGSTTTTENNGMLPPPQLSIQPHNDAADVIFDKIDENNDNVVTYREFQNWFRELDQNNDGVVSRQELMRSSPRSTMLKNHNLDTNGDGVINLKEFMNFFHEIDANHDGVISREELRKILLSKNSDLERGGDEEDQSLVAAILSATEANSVSDRTAAILDATKAHQPPTADTVGRKSRGPHQGMVVLGDETNTQQPADVSPRFPEDYSTSRRSTLNKSRRSHLEDLPRTSPHSSKPRSQSTESTREPAPRKRRSLRRSLAQEPISDGSRGAQSCLLGECSQVPSRHTTRKDESSGAARDIRSGSFLQSRSSSQGDAGFPQRASMMPSGRNTSFSPSRSSALPSVSEADVSRRVSIGRKATVSSAISVLELVSESSSSSVSSLEETPVRPRNSSAHQLHVRPSRLASRRSIAG